jgi:hypothetical protein
MAQVESWLGRCEQSIAHIKQAFALSPRDPVGGVWHTILGVSEVCLGRSDAGILELRRASTGPIFPTPSGLPEE